MMEEAIQGGELTGFVPHIKNDEIYFDRRWLSMIGIKQKKLTFSERVSMIVGHFFTEVYNIVAQIPYEKGVS